MTKIMGILNVTPDSFFDGGYHSILTKAIEKAKELEKHGADYIDIGGESTRPGAKPVTIEEELHRVIPIIEHLQKKSTIPISIDTRNPQVALAAIEKGACLINDISGFEDPKMREIASTFNVKICVMHMQGTPQTMQIKPSYQSGIIPSLLNWFDKRLSLLIKSGVKEENIIIDPGIGFGKTVAHNMEIIHNLQKFRVAGFPILLGISRKSFMGKIVEKDSKDLLATTIAMNTVAILSEVDIIRVHDVKEHRDVIEVLKYKNVDKSITVSNSRN